MAQKHTPEERRTMFLAVLYDQYELHTLKSSLAVTTRRNYLSRVKRFLRDMGSEATVADVTTARIQKYLTTKAKENPQSAPMHHAAVHDFCRFLIASRWLSSDPMAKLKYPKAQKVRRRPVPEIVIAQLLDACDRLPRSEYRRTLAKAVLSLFVYGGLRRSEISALRVGEVDVETGRVFIRNGKGGKERTVYVCKECADALREYAAMRVEAEHDLFFAQSARLGFQKFAIESLMRALHTIAKIEEYHTPHRLRHSCATRIAANGAPLATLSAFLGHADLKTTEIYLHTDEEHLKGIAHLQSLKPVEKPQTPKTAPAPQADNQKERKRFNVRRLR
jgi:integrase/recombinase XerD